MQEWWEFRGVCSGCRKPLRYGERVHEDPACHSNSIDTSWQSRVNPSNERWRPGYRFKTQKTAKGRTYQCYYGVDRNGQVVFEGGVRVRNEKECVAGWQYQVDAKPLGNWYPGCELEDL
jgi:hypothetical protein